MSTCRVLQLQEYRSRRSRRLEQATALYSADQDRATLLRQLWSAVAAARGDRAAVVWVDEYGPGLVHTHVVLDLISDRPRRGFPVDPLRLAWCEGVPGLYDVTERDPVRAFEGGSRSLCAVALGSDGLRAWFVVVDSQTPRPRLSAEAAGKVMFAAGQCTSVVMHRDMTEARQAILAPEGGNERFAAWPVLKDIEGREDDKAANRRISLRFLVARVVRAILDDDLATDAESLTYQIEAVRKEVGRKFRKDPERQCWEAVLDAAEGDDRAALAGAVLALGIHTEEIGHLAGAREFYRSAYEAAMAVGAEMIALDAARFAGRAWRRGSQWDKAFAWYHVASTLAVHLGDRGKEAVVLDGIANVYRERGNLPKAREVLDLALVAALESGDRYAIGSTYHDLMAVAFASGGTGEAIRMGWKAVQTYDREQDQLNALTSLGGVFLTAGELVAAECAYAIVARRVHSPVYRLYALSGFSQVAARRGDRLEYERRLALLDASGFAEGPAVFRAEALIERGRAYELFGELELARACFKEALSVAEAHKVGQFLIQAEEALKALKHKRRTGRSEPPADRSIDGMDSIREELVRMRDRSPVLAGV